MEEKRLVIVAGMGKLPFIIAKSAKAVGKEVCILALKGLAEEGLCNIADRFYNVGIARVGKWIKLTKEFEAKELILAGGVKKKQAFERFRIWRYIPDLTTLKIWYNRARYDRRNLAILDALAQELKEHGIEVINSTKYCEYILADEGIMTKTKPTEWMLEDIEFGWPIALNVARMDIGQAIAVKEKDIIAVEAIEGTDKMIERAGSLAPAGWILIKVAQPHQDMRFDVPTIGPNTVKLLYENHGKAIVVEAGKTIMIEKEKTIATADKYRIPIIGKVAQKENKIG